MLRVEGLQASYGRGQVLFDIRLDIGRGEVITLLGRNGMGKTTTIRSIMGLMPRRWGLIEFDGRPIGECAPEAVARRGVGLVPEGRLIFPTLTVEENLIATAANRLARSETWTLNEIYQLFPRLSERRKQFGRTLSGGEQQMLAIGRALMTNPLLMIFDEATEGLAPVICSEIWSCISLLKSRGQSILIVDRNLKILQRLADRHYIIEKGRTVWSGSSTEMDRDVDLVHRYIGV
ncbi:MAG: ABC transporter ATP-binding protein [Xanthobacteraceae bacterium]